MADINLLSETFELYMKKAKECHQKKDGRLAKKYYMLAAEQMLKMAKVSKGELQKSRYERAKNLIFIADNLNLEVKAPSVSNVEDMAKVVENKKITLEEALKNLNELVGLETVKEKVRKWVEQIKVFQIRKEKNLPVPDITYHMVFTGNPGTGKTTVARIISQIYAALGVVTDGHLVEVDRADLVAGYVGQTAIKTKEVINKSIGGVLFIDEAYALSNYTSNDFGTEVIDTLLKLMDDNRNNLVVIVAGYEDLMNKFINSNPGLKSRFKNFINFEDYSCDELYKIFMTFCQKNKYVLTDSAKTQLLDYFYQLTKNKQRGFGNGRDIRNLFEEIVSNQSNRISKIINPSDEVLITISEEDIPLFKLNLNNLDNTEITEEYKEEKIMDNKPIEKPEEPRKIIIEEGEDEFPEPEKEYLNGVKGKFTFEWDELPSITFDDIAGLKDVKEEVSIKVLMGLKNPEIFLGYERNNGGGLLLYGPPGTGKTMIAAAIAREIGAKFCSVKPSDLLTQGVGNSEKAVRRLFEEARKFDVAVIYFDEIDSITPKSTKSQYARQLRSEFLAQLQGVDAYKKIDNKKILYLIAATNKPWDVDSAFLRPGRFGTKVYVGLPDAEARKYMINKKIEKIDKKGIVKISSDIDIEKLSELTKGFNGADVSNMLDKTIEISAVRCINTLEKNILMQDFEKALEKISTSVQVEDIIKLDNWKKENQF